MAPRRLIMTGLVLILLGTLPFCGDASTAAAAGAEGFVRAEAAPPMSLSFKEGLLFLEAKDADIRELLRAVAAKAGIDLTIGEGVGGKVSLTLSGVSLEEALRRLCQSRAILYEYDPQTRIGRIIGAGAFTAGSVAGSGGPVGAAVSGVGVPPTAGDALAREPEKSGNPFASSQTERLRDKGGEERRYDNQGRLRYKPRELLVRFRPGTTPEQMEALHHRMESIVLKRLDRRKLHRVLLREGLAEKEGMALYLVADIVAAVERHALRYPLLIPNTEPQYEYQWNLSLIGMPAAWDITTGKANITIGVIDTGVDTGHPDLMANLVSGWDFAGTVGGDSNPMDHSGHGTHVSGIIAAVGNNGIGVAGVGWNLGIMPLKVSSDYSGTMLPADIIDAIDYAIDQGLRIVNFSIGGSDDSLEEYLAFKDLQQAKILAVCAAGNGIDNTWPGVDLDTSPEKNYPAYYAHHSYEDVYETVHPALDNILSVAACLNPASQSDHLDKLWGGSNYGLQNVDLMAPGGDAVNRIISTCLSNTYCYKNGTSMAAPHVSGAAGLILSRNPGLSYGRVKSVILNSVDKIDSVVTKLISGGRLNAAAALGMVCLSGDLTKDGRVDLADVILALRIASGLDDGSGACQTADVNRDDQYGLAEAIYGLQVLSGFGR